MDLMTYSELISIILTAITVVLAVLALFIGFLAIWGYSQFREITKAASAEHLEKLLRDGPFSKRIDETIIKHVSSQLADGELRKILIERIDNLAMTDAAKREQKEVEQSEVPFRD
ncbi:MAG TPA: hypothetical protein VNT30_17005 [Stellaceae bacterium]|nr:hypothetical protein [Stellaceae bacterium]